MYHLWRSGAVGGRIKDGVKLLGTVRSACFVSLFFHGIIGLQCMVIVLTNANRNQGRFVLNRQQTEKKNNGVPNSGQSNS